ncbi:probable peroxisomal membrane protein PEX13 [Anoplophora glabripennis]|uniref:probable peroxisomal membrane protein PEX13 n=1 Tax=Anoplophora glabripennis TaxID=217634 RepID=UPI000874A9F4|nr:probable peroxisomal membrane protein PEX13 [Anoplophora glabripennis]
MIRKLALITVIITFSSGFPTKDRTTPLGKRVAIIPADTEDLKTAETFYSGYSTVYPSLGFSSGSYGGGYGWKGDHKPITGSVYGSGYEVGYPGIGSYGAFVPGTLVVSGGPVISGSGGGYGWRQGVNRWAV